MEPSHPLYGLLHYGLLIFLIFAAIAIGELVVGVVPLWAGLLVAVAVGIGYPRLTRWLGVAPARWE